MQPRLTLVLALVACSAVSVCASGNLTPENFDWDQVLTAPRVPLVKIPSLAPTLLEMFKLGGVKGDAPQNKTNNPALIKLSTLMPKLPIIPSFDAPKFNASTTDAEVQGNVTAAVAALRVPLVESVMLPQYVAGLKARIGGEASWLDSMANDTASQQRLCAMMPQFAQRCVQFLTHVQRAKVQALSASLGVLQSMEAQLNTDLATKLAAFNLASSQAVNGNWLCNLAAALDQDIKAGAGSSTSGAYAAKATSAVEKLRDFVSGRWEVSPWWRMQADTQLPKLVATCPITL
ncbi:hypothetical protein MNEG_10949 [Monoraphidium neglectum]|uniref:Uncharacterized protein n=1 Tax=Monoraphidium neglectum TaxID=145388 RepID=A0A0D2MQX9_9CHLO|nr:hypothetical protein MNEG_10949 [Monoraphidium neglectum]KIY97015.1 hypothetical protein MNEG_10949 [Monoraphidium neglectum]|eukprot:XP_013896035.1 hypothetical protein MNEG_10949 [Monoraphidium neglectum]